MVSKSQIKLITSLEQKKNRTKSGLFIVEGKKGIREILNSPFELDSLFTTGENFNAPPSKTHLINEEELKKISRLKTPQSALALFEIPKENTPVIKNLIVALDGIRDPGNLGTIIRLCDWFGIETLLCSNDTVDCYNPKVVQATMGSITRVAITYVDLELILKNNIEQPVIGTFLKGENIYTTQLPKNGILILGNEANGISEEVEKTVSQKLNIPRFGKSQSTESLNVATATAILLSEFRRQANY
ncbi:MAG: RNA methyltransferase [Flavobacteriaceae bacterium]|nr:RNA methyltransferase [Flavobacteriaceae bacterium]